MSKVLLVQANAPAIPLPPGRVHVAITSPPYWAMRSYHTGDQKSLELGSEALADCLGWATGDPCNECFVCHMVGVFREVGRVLHPKGTLWLNLGDSYIGSGGAHELGQGNPGISRSAYRDGLPRRQLKLSRLSADRPDYRDRHDNFSRRRSGYGVTKGIPGLKAKDLAGIPWRVAFALQADGWYLRSAIVWRKCLSGGTQVYARTQKGEAITTIQHLARLDPSTVQLWNGKKWTQVLGWSKYRRKGDELEIVLRSGERISCTPEHRFPTNRGLLEARDLQSGDCLERVTLPESDQPRDCAIDEQAAWFAGLYIAEGSRAGDTIQIAGNAKEGNRWYRVKAIAEHFGGYATRTVDGNQMSIRVYGKVLNAIIDELVTGRTAKDKGFSPVVWRYSNNFVEAMMNGYLSGDGHWEADNQRWRIGFTRNYNLEQDIRTACARLGWKLTLNLSSKNYRGTKRPTFSGSIRQFKNQHWNCKNDAEIVEIRKARCREVYDISIADDPHVFALASGILTHNSNPMVESAPDRPTNCYEFVFLLSKSRRYYYDREAVREPLKQCSIEREKHARGATAKYAAGVPGMHPQTIHKPQTVHQPRPKDLSREPENPGANKRNVWDIPEAEYAQFLRWRAAQHEDHRDVWDISTAGYKGQHFATFPMKLPDICIRAGTSEAGCCPKCFTPYVRVLEPTEAGAQVLGKSWHDHSHDAEQGQSQKKRLENLEEPMYRTVDWRPDCECAGVLQAYPVQVGENTVRTRYKYIPHGRGPSPIPCTVLDPFAGTGTTLVAARALGRDSIGLDLSYRYLHDEAAVRLANPEWDVWENGILVTDWIDMDLAGLPLFDALAAGLLEEE